MKFDYQVVHDKNYAAFYKYKQGGKTKGFLPCGIENFTIPAMQMLYQMHCVGREIDLPKDTKDWYKNGKINLRMLQKYYSAFTNINR